jgi:hypothetical protein
VELFEDFGGRGLEGAFWFKEGRLDGFWRIILGGQALPPFLFLFSNILL